ncbi:O-antigen ligase family protein [bacterium]|nr:O-antigen ligase family protein [bacterium]
MLYLVCGYLVLFIIRPFENWDFGAIRIERIYGIFMLSAFLLSRQRQNIRCPQTTAVFAFLGAIGISFIFSYVPDLAWVPFYKYATLVLFYVVILGTMNNEDKLRTFVLVYICAMAAYQLLSLREYLFFGRGSWDGGIWRMVGYDRTFGGPNSVAASIAYSMPFLLGLLRGNPRGRIRLAVAAYSVLGFACIVLTGSRSGLLAYFFVWLLYILSLPGKRKLYTVVTFCTFLLVAWQLVPSEKQARFRTLLGDHMNEGERGSAEGRIRGSGFFLGLRMFQDRPLFGVGMGCFPRYQREQFGGSLAESHNLYGELIGELGMLGTLAFACLVAIIFKNAVFVTREVRKGNIPRASPSAWVAWAIIVMLLLLLFEGWASHNLDRYNWLWAAAMGVVVKKFALRKENSEKADSPLGGEQHQGHVLQGGMASQKH